MKIVEIFDMQRQPKQLDRYMAIEKIEEVSH